MLIMLILYITDNNWKLITSARREFIPFLFLSALALIESCAILQFSRRCRCSCCKTYLSSVWLYVIRLLIALSIAGIIFCDTCRDISDHGCVWSRERESSRPANIWMTSSYIYKIISLLFIILQRLNRDWKLWSIVLTLKILYCSSVISSSIGWDDRLLGGSGDTDILLRFVDWDDAFKFSTSSTRKLNVDRMDRNSIIKINQ